MKEFFKNKEIYSIVFIYIVAITFFKQSINMRADAGLFPKFLSLLTIILNSLYLLNIIKEKVKLKKEKEEISIKKFYIMLIISILYIIFIRLIGFILSSLIFLIVSMKLLELKNNKKIILIAISTVFIIYVCFSIFLNVPMPTGFLGLIWKPYKEVLG